MLDSWASAIPIVCVVILCDAFYFALITYLQVVDGVGVEMESIGGHDDREEAGDEEVESGAAGNESDMDLDLLAESESDSEESNVGEVGC